VQTVEINLTCHAIARFHERVRPTLDRRAAEDELARLVAIGLITSEAPFWHATRQRQRAHAYLVVGDLVLPLKPQRGDQSVLIAVTCIARGGLSDAARARRNERRRGRAQVGGGALTRANEA